MSSDERLALRAARGDERAFAEIYERYHQDLYRFCLAMVGHPHDAQDTLHNTMVKVLRSLPGEERKIQLKPWLYRIARNEAIETLRKRRDDVELEPHQVAVASTSETAEARERLRALLADLEQLPERQRAALVMRELSGLGFEQIAAAFGSSPAVARQTLYEARLSLRQLEAGREMRCDDVMRELSDADGRAVRRREIRAHLRDCADCRAFRDRIARRHEDLAALAPLPVAAAAGLLHGVLGGNAASAAAGGGGGIAAAAGGGAGKAVATSAIVKSAATVAIAVVAGVSADRSGLVDLPLPGKSEHAAAPSTTQRLRVPRTGAAAANAVSARNVGQGKQTPAKGAGSQGSQGGGGLKQEGPSANEGAPGGDSSNSGAGSSPPGGGYGRSASARHGRPEGLPEAAAHGQQAAAEHKPSHAATPPGKSHTGGNHGSSSGGGTSPASKHPTSLDANPPPAPSADPPPSEASQPGEDRATAAPTGAQPGLER